jgi:hypothetical protein
MTNSAFTMAVAVLSAATFAGPASAELVLQGPMHFQGTGLGAVNTVLTIQSPGNSSFESGSVGMVAGSMEGVLNGDVKTGASQTQLLSLGSLGLTSAADLRVVFNATEPGNAAAQGIVLNDLQLSIYRSDGTLLFSSGPFSPVTFNDTFNGVGNSGFVFALDPAWAAQAQALAFGPGSEGNLIGLSATASGATGGPETFFITAIPEPDTYLLMAVGAAALGFIARRRRSGTVAR